MKAICPLCKTAVYDDGHKTDAGIHHRTCIEALRAAQRAGMQACQRTGELADYGREGKFLLIEDHVSGAGWEEQAHDWEEVHDLTIGCHYWQHKRSGQRIRAV